MFVVRFSRMGLFGSLGRNATERSELDHLCTSTATPSCRCLPFVVDAVCLTKKNCRDKHTFFFAAMSTQDCFICLSAVAL